MSGQAEVGTRPSAATELDYATEPELLQALFAVFHHFDLKDQTASLLGTISDWTGADCGFGLIAGDDPEIWVPMVSTVPREDPRAHAVGRFNPKELRVKIGDQPVVHPGLGPLSSSLHRWPKNRPASTMSIPLRNPDGDWGGLLLLMFRESPEGEALERVERLIELASPAIGHGIQVRAMRELVIKDDTAQCFNRRHFEDLLPEEISRASRFHAPLSLIFLDMDNLKRVNSNHGHSMGSRTLTEVSQRIRTKIRKFDKLFRFGGDEFCIVLPETEWQGAMEVAERVRESISSRRFLTEFIEGGIDMSASLGIAAFPLHARTKQDLVQQADRAMQRIKLGTKNSIGVAEASGGVDGSGTDGS